MYLSQAISDVLARLNPQQRAAATHGRGSLLVVAGAGTGKTATLVQRVAWLMAKGADPARILLLTFTRRAAAEMLRRVDTILHHLAAAVADDPSQAAGRERFDSRRVWGGTFHAVANRLLRRYAKAIGLPNDFSVLDRTDAEDLMNVVRTEQGLAKTDARFPKKGTCTDIYSRCVNAREPLPEVLEDVFPWCRPWAEELKRLFDAYVDRKEAMGALDYDDLLLYWHALLADPKAGDTIRGLFDHVLVDEYQDTNVLQAEILYLLSPKGEGLSVVGDDAQSIYAFRAATVRNILDFPKHYPGTTVVTLEQNYRSTCPILETTNRVIGQARERYTKNLWSERTAGQRPRLVCCVDEADQAEFVIRRILTHREEGIDLRRQAVLFRASHHSIVLEAELSRHNIPFHKYGGLKFVEAAHVKDLLAFLRLAENPRDIVSGTRLLLLLPGIGPAKARQLTAMLEQSGGDLGVWEEWKPPPPAAELWPKLVALVRALAGTRAELAAQVHQVRLFYAPLLEMKYDYSPARLRDLGQLEQIASRYRSRQRMLTEMALDPPNSTQDLAGPPVKDDDYLVLSTIHSAKGLEWDAVYVIHASDGNIPSDMSTGKPEEIEEELRLFYVALTRAKDWLYVCRPLRYYRGGRPGMSDPYSLAQLTRFITPSVAKSFEQQVSEQADDEGEAHDEDDASSPRGRTTSRDVRRRTKDLWK